MLLVGTHRLPAKAKGRMMDIESAHDIHFKGEFGHCDVEGLYYRPPDG